MDSQLSMMAGFFVDRIDLNQFNEIDFELK
jgi:hypothetical protein